MTTASDALQPPLPPEPAGSPPASVSASTVPGVGVFWQRFDEVLDGLSDRLNPILVKESRQAMKSRQFVVTFSLLLICGWVWTVLFIVSGLPAIYYAPAGPGVLMGYYAVLSVPLLIVVPYAAFRSLAGEWEDGTFELLSAASVFNMTGGTIVINQPSTGTPAPIDFNNQATILAASGTLRVGTGATVTNFNYRVRGSIPNFVIDNTTNNKTATATALIRLWGTTTINTGTT
jgi:hypothetical protein